MIQKPANLYSLFSAETITSFLQKHYIRDRISDPVHSLLAEVI